MHQDLAAGKWATLTLAEQLGNVGSEVGRAFSWKKRGNQEQSEKAMQRAFELLDLTIGSYQTYPRLKELARVRENLADFFYGDNEHKSVPEQIEKYFFQFALLARRGL